MQKVSSRHLQSRLSLNYLAQSASQPPLLHYNAFIGGRWVEASGGQRFSVQDPYVGDDIAQVADCSRVDAERAIQAASKAFLQEQQPMNKNKHAESLESVKTRGQLLMEWHRLIQENRENLAAIVVAENGKPLKEALGEVAYAASFVKYYGEMFHNDQQVNEGRQLDCTSQKHSQLVMYYEPVGVCALITPWNFPLAMLTRKMAPALAAGNTVVVKPAAETPLSAAALVQLADRAGFAAGSVNLLPCSRQSTIEVGQALCGSDFGSTAVGVKLMQQCAPTVKRVSMELGGNAPFVVFAGENNGQKSDDVADDQYLQSAVSHLLAAKLRNAGQTCVAPNRVLVQRSVYTRFVNLLVDSLNIDYNPITAVGSGYDLNVKVGPMINRQGVEKVRQHVEDALSKGARLVYGKLSNEASQGNIQAPIVLLDCSADMMVAQQETFGPVFSLFQFDEVEQGIHMANDTEFGLAAYLTHPIESQGRLIASRLEAGMVGVNTGVISFAQIPFGGVKHSGVGREGSIEGLREYQNIKYCSIGKQ